MYKTNDQMTHQRVTDLLSEEMNIQIPAPDTDLMENGYLDSLRFIRMLTLLEEAFDIQIALDELEFELFKTVDGITEFIRQKQKAPNPHP